MSDAICVVSTSGFKYRGCERDIILRCECDVAQSSTPRVGRAAAGRGVVRGFDPREGAPSLRTAGQDLGADAGGVDHGRWGRLRSSVHASPSNKSWLQALRCTV